MFNPALASMNIRYEFVDYISSSYSISDPIIRNLFQAELSRIISKGPIVEISDVFTSGKSIRELINEMVLSPLFIDIEKNKSGMGHYRLSLPLDRPLYKHQETAICNIVNGHNQIISTGTGSGKTECFLIPVINSLLREKEKGTLNAGVRAIFIYPMNALANDQLKRIRELLLYYPEITFGVYNGSTQYDDDEANNLYKSMFNDEEIPELREPLRNEILSRKRMQDTPPHILFTNYAMLEHMLLRPNDAKVFEKSSIRFIVLDEAHVYNGATGMETAYLIRRLKARIKSKNNVQYILTSATLGSGDGDNQDVVNFGSNLCGSQFSLSDIVKASRKKYIPELNQIDYPKQLFLDLSNEENYLGDVLQKCGISYDPTKEESEIIYDLCASSSTYGKVRSELSSPESVTTLCRTLELSEDELVAFLFVCSKAYKGGKALLNVRYHFFLRALEGLYLTFNPSVGIFSTRKQFNLVNDTYYPVYEVATCSDCGRLAVIGKVKNNERSLETNIHYGDESNFYYLHPKNEELLSDEEVDFKGEKYYLCTKCNSLTKHNEMHNRVCKCDEVYLKEIIEAKGDHCPSCGVGRYQKFYLGIDAATSVIGTSLFDQLPGYIYEAPESNSDNDMDDSVFNTGSSKLEKTKVSTGKQFLIFSDSRQEAAFFSSYMDSYYKSFIRRRGIYQLLNQKVVINERVSVTEFAERLSNIYSTNNSFSKSNSDRTGQKLSSTKNAWIAILDEMVNQRRSSSMVSMGLMKFKYLGNNEQLASNISKKYEIDTESAMALLDVLVNEIVRNGAIKSEDDNTLDDDDRKYIFFAAKQKYVCLIDNLKETYKFSFQARGIPGKENQYYKNNRLLLVMNTLGLDQKSANKFLADYWKYLIDKVHNKYALMSDNNLDYMIKASSIAVISYRDAKSNWYQCEKCNKITPYNNHNKCELVKCGGTIKKVESELIIGNNHFAKLYSIDRLNPFFIKEHTAQLSKRDSLEYQKLFVKKEINALSCSTTFEMGVDVGGLETVFLRNVPPLPSNYAQRAGRAGRSKNSAAYAITYAKLSSHDFNFFAHPNEMIKGVILPPLFKIENEKVAYRHIFAVALASFFQKYPNQYHGNQIKAFIDEKGYEEFEKYINSKPSDLLSLIRDSIPPNMHDILHINDFGWSTKLFGHDGALTIAIDEYEEIVRQFDRLIAKTSKNDIELSSYTRNLRKFKDKQLIDFLVRNNVLPKYGFPIDTVELSQNMDTKADFAKDLNLTRDLQIAISEYAPGSEIVADGKLFTSRYIKQAATKEGRKHWEIGYLAMCEDPTCKTMNFRSQLFPDEKYHCISCNSELRRKIWSQSIEPRAGFIADKIVKPVPSSKPEKHYRSEDYYIKNLSATHVDSQKLTTGEDSIVLETTTNDSLMVVSNDKFYVCKVCGYSRGMKDEETNKDILKKKESEYESFEDDKVHYKSFGSECQNLKLTSYKLHHIFKTDVVKITFSRDISDIVTTLSVLYALLDATSNVLDIERDDIKGCLHKFQDKDGKRQNAFVIYDSVPGGVGHSRRLISEDGSIMKRIIQRAFDNMQSCDCEPSCYRCLRNYQNQRIHESLDRIKARDYLAAYCGDISGVENGYLKNNLKQVVRVEFYKEDAGDFDLQTWENIEDFSSPRIKPIIEVCKEDELDLPYNCFGKIRIEETKYNYEFIWIDKKIVVFSELPEVIDDNKVILGGWVLIDPEHFELKDLKEKLNG